MTRKTASHIGRGPFRADQLRSKDPYELSRGHPIECLPTGARGSRANLAGGLVLATDPDVESAGVDTGFSPSADTLRAPDLAVGNVPDAPGWAKGAPLLAVEYADTGQDEADLAVKIRELFAAGTRLIWVARLTGPRRVEVHRPDGPLEIRTPGDLLDAPGILRNPVPVEALFDRDAAAAATLRNLLQRSGYADLEAVKSEGERAGELIALRGAILQVLESRGLTPGEATRTRIDECADPATLTAWLRRAATIADAGDLLDAS